MFLKLFTHNFQSMRAVLSLILTLLLSPLFSQGTHIKNAINLDQVVDQYGLTGKGVLIIMIERGIDYRHPDFIDKEGNTRIAYIYDMLDNSGASFPDNPYGIGTIFNRDQINASLNSGTDYLSNDRFGHGTATTGIAAGNGSGSDDPQFSGVAPEATIISIKINHDNFPAIANQPGQTGYFNAAFIPVALQFARDKADELGMPSVALLNVGSIGGPTDGTSLISRSIDDYILAGYTLLCGVGDDGGADNYAEGTVSQDATTEVLIGKNENGNLRLDLWYSENDRFDVSIEKPDGNMVGPFSAPGGPGISNDQLLDGINIYHRGANVEFAQATSDRRELMIDISGATGTYKLKLYGSEISSDGTFKTSLNPSRHSNTNKFLSHVVSGHSINDYASSLYSITPGDYVADNSWTDINGINRSRTNEGDSGEIWSGSSWGPTQDGRLGIDFAVPGEVCYAAYSEESYYSNFAFNKIQGGNGYYGVQNAVSAAAPVATGIIALMLEKNKNLTPSAIRSILQISCVSDAHTGTVPNNIWGYGKLDALQAVQNTPTANSRVFTHAKESLTVFPSIATRVITISSHAGSVIQNVRIMDLAGKEVIYKDVLSGNTSFNIAHLENGTYVIIALTENGQEVSRFIKN